MMRIFLGFALGVVTGLAFTRIPHFYPAIFSRGDSDDIPSDFPGARYQHWTNGIPD